MSVIAFLIKWSILWWDQILLGSNLGIPLKMGKYLLWVAWISIGGAAFGVVLLQLKISLSQRIWTLICDAHELHALIRFLVLWYLGSCWCPISKVSYTNGPLSMAQSPKLTGSPSVWFYFGLERRIIYGVLDTILEINMHSNLDLYDNNLIISLSLSLSWSPS